MKEQRSAVGELELAWDSRGEGPPVLLVMGIGSQLIHWPEGFCDALADRGYRVIRYDNRDVGHSTWLDSAGVPAVRKLLGRRMLGLSIDAPYDLSDMADDAVGLLDALLIERAHVVGISMGGMIAQQLALDRTERVLSLTSIMSTPGDLWVSLGTPRAIQALLGKRPHSREQAIERMGNVLSVIGSTRWEQDAERIADVAGRAWDRGVNPPGFARQFAAILASPSRTARLKGLNLPVGVVHGSVDPLIPPRGGRATARAVPEATFTLIDGMGHDLPAQAWPELVDAIVSTIERA